MPHRRSSPTRMQECSSFQLLHLEKRPSDLLHAVAQVTLEGFPSACNPLRRPVQCHNPLCMAALRWAQTGLAYVELLLHQTACP